METLIVEGHHIYFKVNPGLLICDAYAIILCNTNEKLDPPFSVEPKVYKSLHGDAP